jgi:cytochrome c biogenesis protein CcmG, thiol:disulfide interchange protein DsbE
MTAPTDRKVDDAGPPEPSGTSRRFIRWAAAVAAVAALGLAVVLGSRFGTDPTLVNSPLIGQPAPDLTLPFLEGDGGLSLQGLEGGIVVVNFWASWCIACRAEHPDLMATAEAYEELGVRFLGISYQDSPTLATRFLDDLGWGGENYDYVTDPDTRAAIEMGVFGVPETFFIDEKGIIVGKISGQSNALLLGRTLDQILQGQRPGNYTAGTIQSEPGQ